MAQLVFEGLEIEDRKVILSRVTDLSTKDEFQPEDRVHGRWAGEVREVRVRTKDGSTVIKTLVVVDQFTIADEESRAPSIRRETPEEEEPEE